MTVPHDRATASLGEFQFECGESIPDLEIAYETYGEFTGDNAVLIVPREDAKLSIVKGVCPGDWRGGGLRDRAGRGASRIRRGGH